MLIGRTHCVMNTMPHEGVAPIPIRLLAIKVIACVAYPILPYPGRRSLSRAVPVGVVGGVCAFPQISPYLILSLLALTPTLGISGGNYFPAFPPTCRALRSLLTKEMANW